MKSRLKSSGRSGVILVAALMVLIVLASITTTIVLKLGERHRSMEYLIGYQQARYGCDSAYKYALASSELLNLRWADRADAPDFSDTFRYSDAQLTEIKQAWADEINDPEKIAEAQEQASEFTNLLLSMFGLDDPSAATMLQGLDFTAGLADPNTLEIPGPYGPQWPYICEPIEFSIGTSRVHITIEDENAKLPLVWFLDAGDEKRNERESILLGFCTWVGAVNSKLEEAEIAADELKEKLMEIAAIKSFDFSNKAIVITERVDPSQQRETGPVTVRRIDRTTRLPVRPNASAANYQSRVRPVTRSYADYSRLFAANLPQIEWLTTTFVESDKRQEYPLKYMGVWGSTQVNINSAPRHVLEAALAWGGDPTELASVIIERRQERPYGSIKELRDENLVHAYQVEQVEQYITTQSTIFTIKISSHNGPARSTATIAVLKQGNRATKIGAVFD